MNTMIKSARAALVALAAVTFTGPALAAGKGPEIERQDWSFAGPFGSYDRAQLQRGFKVFKEVCASCHGAEYLAFRNLAQPGGPEFTEDQAKVIAAEYMVPKGVDEWGDPVEGPAVLADRWPSPFPNETAARASNNGAYPVDFSTLAKARAVASGFPGFVFDIFTQYQEQGPDYIYNLLTGYEDPPEDVNLLPGQYYNPKFISGNAISMAPPLFEEAVEYTDGTPMTVEQYAKDVSAFMMWVAEPKLEERKSMGFRVMIFLIVFASLLYFTKKSLWRDVEH
ncbi:cytochrome c1 [Stappia sp.]|uniref:cytochrome c1 n=1 Tax=Stappia sp. TaxID=1870903 RepID=UPI0032D8E0A3